MWTPFDRWRKCASERLSIFLHITQLVRGTWEWNSGLLDSHIQAPCLSYLCENIWVGAFWFLWESWFPGNRTLFQLTFLTPWHLARNHCSVGLSEWSLGERKLTCPESLLCADTLSGISLKSHWSGVIFVLQPRKRQRTLLAPKLRKEIRCSMTF